MNSRILDENELSPLPWRVVQPFAARYYGIARRPGSRAPAIDGDGRAGNVVESFEEPCAGEGGIPRRVDAEFIVRACNAYDGLLAALRDLTNECVGRAGAPAHFIPPGVLDRVRIALAKAEPPAK